MGTGRFCCFACGLLENFVFPHGDVSGIFLLQRLKEKVKGRLEVVAVLPGPAVFDHIHDHFKVLFLRRSLMEQVEDQGCIQGNF